MTIIINQGYLQEVDRRRTCAIISHPDAGKTTVTEKMLLFGQRSKSVDRVENRIRSGLRQTKSDWMAIEKQRGISVTTSVMQFSYGGCLINLLDTPGHEDFSEDTYRTLTAVDCCFMVIDAAKGVEDRTRKLMEVARLRNTPIITFINKLDREVRYAVELLDQIESELSIVCTPITWPIGCGKLFKGIYHLEEDNIYLYQSGKGAVIHNGPIIKGLNNQQLDEHIDSVFADEVRDEVALIKGVVDRFQSNAFSLGKSTPVFFGTALGNFGIDHLLNALVAWGPRPQFRLTNERVVSVEEEKFSGFIFKIQANMDPKHRDRVAFMRIVSGKYQEGMRLFHVRLNKYVTVSGALTFMAGDREHIDEAYAGDIIGLHNHGTIRIGDTFTQNENIKFIGIPNFAPELFKRIRLRDPLKQKQLLKGLVQLTEEGAVQFFRPLMNNDLLIGAVGVLQFDVVVARLKLEYNVEAIYESIDIITVRWVDSDNVKKLNDFRSKYKSNLALDSGGYLTYVTSSMVNLGLMQERHPEINFSKTREH